MDLLQRTPSDKRRVWIAVTLYVSAIYLTLPIVRPILRFIYDSIGRGTASIVVSSVLLVVAAVIFVSTLRKGLDRLALIGPPMAALAVVLYFMNLPEERIHFIEYGVLGFLLIKATGTRYRQLALSLVIVVIAGSVDELIQFLLPNRVGDIRDVSMNTAGGMIGLWVGRYWFLP